MYNDNAIQNKGWKFKKRRNSSYLLSFHFADLLTKHLEWKFSIICTFSFFYLSSLFILPPTKLCLECIRPLKPSDARLQVKNRTISALCFVLACVLIQELISPRWERFKPHRISPFEICTMRYQLSYKTLNNYSILFKDDFSLKN